MCGVGLTKHLKDNFTNTSTVKVQSRQFGRKERLTKTEREKYL